MIPLTEKFNIDLCEVVDAVNGYQEIIYLNLLQEWGRHIIKDHIF